jgi:hypothetical protein
MKFDLALVIVSIAAFALWIEHGHRVVIDAPAHAQGAVVAPAAACPDNDNVPYSAGCIAFLEGRSASGMQWRVNAAESSAAPWVPSPR